MNTIGWEEKRGDKVTWWIVKLVVGRELFRFIEGMGWQNRNKVVNMGKVLGADKNKCQNNKNWRMEEGEKQEQGDRQKCEEEVRLGKEEERIGERR